MQYLGRLRSSRRNGLRLANRPLESIFRFHYFYLYVSVFGNLEKVNIIQISVGIIVRIEISTTIQSNIPQGINKLTSPIVEVNGTKAKLPKSVRYQCPCIAKFCFFSYFFIGVCYSLQFFISQQDFYLKEVIVRSLLKGISSPWERSKKLKGLMV